jgi:hypothetical protein
VLAETLRPLPGGGRYRRGGVNLGSVAEKLPPGEAYWRRAGTSSGNCAEGVMRFLIHQFTGKLERGADLGTRQSVFACHFFKVHAARKIADNQRDGHPCAANHRPAVADFRINDDLVVRGFSLTLVLILASRLFILPMHLRRDFQAQAV